MSNVSELARDLSRTLDKAAVLLEKYLSAVQAHAAESGRDSTAGGLGGRQLRQILTAHVVARLSPKPRFGFPAPPVQLEGAPELRRYAAAHPLPGL